MHNVRYVIISAYHDYRTSRRANLHFIAEELAKLGPVAFISLRFSHLTRFREDPRHLLWERANRVEMVDGVLCYLWRTPIHPFRMPPRVEFLEPALFSPFARYLPSSMKQIIRNAETILIESGLGIIYAPLLKRINREARLIYMASDSLSTINQAKYVRNCLNRYAHIFTSARVPSPILAAELPHNLRSFLVPHGIEKEAFANIGGSPFPPNSINAVSVGSMLFDRSFFEIAGPRFPEITFHAIGSGCSERILDNVVFYPTTSFLETLPFIKYANFAIAPYGQGVAPYLTHTSMKLMQYDFLKIPAVCPQEVVGTTFARFGYKRGDPRSIAKAISDALSIHKSSSSKHLSWADVTARILAPHEYTDTMLAQHFG